MVSTGSCPVAGRPRFFRVTGIALTVRFLKNWVRFAARRHNELAICSEWIFLVSLPVQSRSGDELLRVG
jgi:hypothetical protein